MSIHICPRCEALLSQASDMYGGYFSCVQCGYYKDIIIDIVIPASMYGHRKPGRKRPNRIVEINTFLNRDRQARQIIKKEVI